MKVRLTHTQRNERDTKCSSERAERREKRRTISRSVIAPQSRPPALLRRKRKENIDIIDRKETKGRRKQKSRRKARQKKERTDAYISRELSLLGYFTRRTRVASAAKVMMMMMMMRKRRETLLLKVRRKWSSSASSGGWNNFTATAPSSPSVLQQQSPRPPSRPRRRRRHRVAYLLFFFVRKQERREERNQKRERKISPIYELIRHNTRVFKTKSAHEGIRIIHNTRIYIYTDIYVLTPQSVLLQRSSDKLDDSRCRSVLSVHATDEENTPGGEIREIRPRFDARRTIPNVFRGTQEEERKRETEERVVLWEK